MSSRHTLSVLVENKPGVLTRVSALFARRAFNIHSLAVGPTEDPDTSRITVVVEAAEHPLEQVVKQLNKLVNTIKVVELHEGSSVERELMLVKVAADDRTRTAVLQVVDLFRARVIDVVPSTVTVEATGSPQKLDALLTSLSPYGIKEIVQSGAVAIARGARGMKDKSGAANSKADKAGAGEKTRRIGSFAEHAERVGRARNGGKKAGGGSAGTAAKNRR